MRSAGRARCWWCVTRNIVEKTSVWVRSPVGSWAASSSASSGSSRLSAAEAFLRVSQGGDRRGLAWRFLQVAASSIELELAEGEELEAPVATVVCLEASTEYEFRLARTGGGLVRRAGVEWMAAFTAPGRVEAPGRRATACVSQALSSACQP